MEALGIWLIAIGFADLIAGYSGQITNRPRCWWALVIAAALAVSLALLSDFELVDAALLGACVWVSLGAWFWARAAEDWSPRRASATLAGAAAVTVTMAVSTAVWPEVSHGTIQRLLDRLPFPVIAGQDQGRLMLAVGAILVLQASCNALVRLLLAVVGTSEATQKSLRGGRFIGPMERTLIFGLGLAGFLTAAAVVATAKGLLRFPEISKEENDIHKATEYFLVGSLASWILALAPLVLL